MRGLRDRPYLWQIVRDSGLQSKEKAGGEHCACVGIVMRCTDYWDRLRRSLNIRVWGGGLFKNIRDPKYLSAVDFNFRQNLMESDCIKLVTSGGSWVIAGIPVSSASDPGWSLRTPSSAPGFCAVQERVTAVRNNCWDTGTNFTIIVNLYHSLRAVRWAVSRRMILGIPITSQMGS